MRRNPHLLVVDPSIVSSEQDGIDEVLFGWPGDATVVRPALESGTCPAPGEFADSDGIVLLGSKASVHDDAPWLTELRAFLRPIVDGTREQPLLAICVGPQHVAEMAGGKVGFARRDHSPVLGVVETALFGGRLVPGERLMWVAASHCERVTEVPAGFDVVARRPESDADMLEHRTLPIFAAQFHPEAREGFLKRRGVDPAAVPASFFEDGRRVLAGFRRFVLSRRA